MSSTTISSVLATPTYNPKNPNNITPAIPPPPGVLPNFIDPDTLWRWNVLCMTVCLFFSTIPFVLRCYVRVFIKREWVLEDYGTCLGWACFVTYCALTTTVMDRHGGVHEWEVTTANVKEVYYWFNVVSIEYGIAQAAVKLSILLFYRRVFVPRRHSAFDLFLRLCEVTIAGFYIATTFVKIFECNPRQRIWDRSIPGTCVDIPSLLSTSGFFNLLTDTIILLIPVKSVWSLKMKRKKKLLVIMVFSVGSIAPVFSLIGIIIRFELLNNPDATYYQPEVLLWAAAEVCTGLICLCLPPLSILLQRSQRSRRRRPSESILAGESGSRGQGSSGQLSYHKRKLGLSSTTTTDEDLLTGDYAEPKDGWQGTFLTANVHPTPGAIERPGDVHLYGGDRHHVHTHAHADPLAYRYGPGQPKNRAQDSWIDDDVERGEVRIPDQSERSAHGDGKVEGVRSVEEGLRRSPTGIMKTVEIKQSYI